MRWRAIQPAIFGLAALSFMLPFAHVSCSTDQPAQSGPLVEDFGRGSEELKGYELVVGRDLQREVAAGFAIEEGDVHVGGEPFAVVAFGAAVAGVGAVFVPQARRRAVTGLVAGAIGVLSLIVLGLAPVQRTFGLLEVSWKLGYWVCLTLFALATTVAYLEQRDARPPPYLRRE
ncbi:MAG TPA: hypothetical protein VEV43_07695 [Actinomycetota bacterium]|nr:hypothetical protein [Actinomycetota bacterium]